MQLCYEKGRMQQRKNEVGMRTAWDWGLNL